MQHERDCDTGANLCQQVQVKLRGTLVKPVSSTDGNRQEIHPGFLDKAFDITGICKTTAACTELLVFIA